VQGGSANAHFLPTIAGTRSGQLGDLRAEQPLHYNVPLSNTFTVPVLHSNVLIPCPTATLHLCPAALWPHCHIVYGHISTSQVLNVPLPQCPTAPTVPLSPVSHCLSPSLPRSVTAPLCHFLSPSLPSSVTSPLYHCPAPSLPPSVLLSALLSNSTESDHCL
jgi:hypothetical protein